MVQNALAKTPSTSDTASFTSRHNELCPEFLNIVAGRHIAQRHVEGDGRYLVGWYVGVLM